LSILFISLHFVGELRGVSSFSSPSTSWGD
jgi:hypothetical protein